MTLNVQQASTVAEAESRQQFVSDLQYYLAQDPRQLPSHHLYDALGSALFEAICMLPWYTLTRAEARLLQAHAADILDAAHPVCIVELGPGNGDKLAMLLEAGGGTRRRQLELHLVDVSSAALARAARTLAAVGNVRIVTHETTYEAGLLEFGARRVQAGRTLALFLGSNLGNFDPPGRDAFLRNIRTALRQGDTLLLGADLVKPERDLLLAYDDPLGVTAAFNRNLLVRINRELDGNFDLDGFAHRAVWNEAQSRVEMHLVSRRTQDVTIGAAKLELHMSEGESIWTESSYKYRPEELASLLDGCGFRVARQWIDPEGFALTCAEAV